MLERRLDDLLLNQRHLLGADLDAEVATRHHHGVGGLDDRAHVGERLGLLELGDDAGGRARRVNPLAQATHVADRAHERQRHEVDAELERESEILHVLLRQRRHRNRHARDVDALLRADLAADEHATGRLARRDALDAKPDEPVVDHDIVARLEGIADRRRRHGQIRRRGARVSGERHLLPRSDLDGRGEIADPHLRSLEVGDQGEGPAGPLLRLANQPHAHGVVGLRSVGEVQPRRIHAGRDQLVDHGGRGRRRADRTDDLRAATWLHGRRVTRATRRPAGRPHRRQTWPAAREPPRFAATGCTSPPGRSWREHPS